MTLGLFVLQTTGALPLFSAGSQLKLRVKIAAQPYRISGRRPCTQSKYKSTFRVGNVGNGQLCWRGRRDSQCKVLCLLTGVAQRSHDVMSAATSDPGACFGLEMVVSCPFPACRPAVATAHVSGGSSVRRSSECVSGSDVFLS